MKVNYHLAMMRVLADLEREQRRPRLLLHSCCAPCSSYALETLSQYFDLTVFYYNPNIAPKEEFLHRVAEQQRLIREMPLSGKVDFLCGEWDSEAFYAAAKGLEDVPEGGERCTRCFRLRLGKAAQVAAEGGFDFFTTTLTISPLKDAQRLNAIGMEMGERFGVPWLPSDFKKNNGYRRSCELSAEYGLYRQDYCGCEFSKRERDNRIVNQNKK